jgi:hypothetical protein
VGAGQAVQFLGLLIAQQALELVEALKAEGLGELVVDRRVAGDLHRGHLDVEGGGLALEVLGRIIVGKLTLSVRSSPTFTPTTCPRTRAEGAQPNSNRHVGTVAALERPTTVEVLPTKSITTWSPVSCGFAATSASSKRLRLRRTARLRIHGALVPPRPSGAPAFRPSS